MVQYTKVSFYKVNLMGRVFIFTSQSIMMILKNIKVYGLHLNLMESVEHYIIMEMYMKENSLKVKDVVMDVTGLIRFISMSDNGNTIVFGVKESCIKIRMSSFKDSLRRG
jgi:hypothetical protein